jgi:hypothetical protein
MSKKEELLLFDKGEGWENEWQGMPEFVQKDLTPFKTIYVHFENAEDMRAFAELVQQQLTTDTQYIWFPESDRPKPSTRKYVDES